MRISALGVADGDDERRRGVSRQVSTTGLPTMRRAVLPKRNDTRMCSTECQREFRRPSAVRQPQLSYTPVNASFAHDQASTQNTSVARSNATTKGKLKKQAKLAANLASIAGLAPTSHAARSSHRKPARIRFIAHSDALTWQGGSSIENATLRL